ncbi:sulfurtransferase [Corynebacterium sp. 13CS0277]|uniref:sulfurtransferase n=1 Tax=Corynebacterium sp. 13CS0277 TaxID=2071994 RepID=UPI000D044EFF|nr:sulfurtransferase [Corynebacterium sp. 13CS0277]PRQ12017.1 sulfurtransferase [Corynebacterium sp. 13CS0277]
MTTNNTGAPTPTALDSSVPPLITAAALQQMLAEDPSRLVVLCASMGNPARALQEGIPGALLADIEAEFSEADAEFPHTVPADVQAPFAACGISDDSVVVVYDRHGVVVSPRVWWLAQAAGLRTVFVLDGGLPAWVAAGGATAPIATPQDAGVAGGEISAQPRPELFTDIRGVERALARSASAVVDARSAGRFAGVAPEPRPHMRAGHIPGSVNVPFETLFAEDGTFLPAVQLRQIFAAQVGDATQLVFSCGSGVTACVTALGARLAGWEDLVVYDGSWSQWGSADSQQPIAT